MTQMSTADSHNRLTEKLRQPRERTRLSPDDLAPHVKAKSGAKVIGYESGADVPLAVLYAYAELSGIPVENILQDDRDLWFGHLRLD